jgi:hypothetical protein
MRPTYLAILLAFAAAPAAADKPRLPEHPVYKAECGSCHVAYPPRLLSAASWRQLMAGLDKHFGSDASLDPALRAEIEGFLSDNAGRRGGRQLRITETRWFLKEHRNEIPAGKNPANCIACHTRAEDGYYDDD